MYSKYEPIGRSQKEKGIKLGPALAIFALGFLGVAVNSKLEENKANRTIKDYTKVAYQIPPHGVHQHGYIGLTRKIDDFWPGKDFDALREELGEVNGNKGLVPSDVVYLIVPKGQESELEELLKEE